MKLTVFTPTYNRAYSLPKLYNSLKKQTDNRFEWLIIDDGSTDNTKELIESYIKENHNFEIRYYVQPHLGKPTAQNIAMDLAKGEYFITCDSNKYLNNNAVEDILKVAVIIEEDPKICGIGGYRSDFKGNIYGGEMKVGREGYIDCTNLERNKYNLSGDKSTAFKTKIIKKYKSPIFSGETFISESIWLIPMALDGYKIRWIPKIFCFGEYTDDGLTKQGANSYIGHYQNYYGFLACIKMEMRINNNIYLNNLIIEALEICKNKNLSYQFVGEQLGCSRKDLYIIMFRDKIQHYLKNIISIIHTIVHK